MNTEAVLLAGYSSLIAILGLLGNTAIILATCSYKSFHLDSITLQFVRHLAITDICYIVLRVLPNICSHLGGGWVLGEVVCEVTGTLYLPAISTNMLLLLVTSLHRYYRCVDPVGTRARLNRTRADILILVTWCLPLCYTLLSELFKKAILYNPNIGLCDYTYSSNLTLLKEVVKLFQLILPGLGIILVNLLLWAAARRFSRRMNVATRQANLTVMLISSSFVLCWSPTFIEEIWRVVWTRGLPTWFDTGHVYVFFLSVILNPLTYCLTNKAFATFMRNTILRLVGARVRLGNRSPARSRRLSVDYVPSPSQLSERDGEGDDKIIIVKPAQPGCDISRSNVDTANR